MKNVPYVLFIIAVTFLIASCKKTDTSGTHGSWSMKGINYSVKSCGFVDDVMYATDGTTDTLFIVFANNVRPTATGDYQMQLTNPGAGEASVQIYFHGQYYLPDNATEYIRATVANGKVSATGTNIHVADPSTPYDVATVVFNITQ